MQQPSAPAIPVGPVDVRPASPAPATPPDDAPRPASSPGAVPVGALPRLSVAPAVACAAVGGAVFASFWLFHATAIGGALGALGAAVTWVALARIEGRRTTPVERAVLASIALLAALPAVRASPWLHAYDLAFVVALVLLLPWASRTRSPALTLFAAGREAHAALSSAIAGGVGVTRELKEDGAQVAERMRAPLIGLGVSVPIVLVFLLLFLQADAAFNHLVQDALREVSASFLARAAVALGATWALLGLARGVRAGFESETVEPKTLAFLGPKELLFAVLAVDALFALFLAVQGLHVARFAMALSATDVTYSSAAREGFFQLLTVVGIVIGLVLVAGWLLDTRADRKTSAAPVRAALALLLALTGGVAATALLRMARYTDAYGLTELRFHASALMLFLVVLLAWLGVTVVHGRRARFLPGALAGAVGAVITLHAVNPDAMIARVNLARGESLDVAHLSALSDDAVPTLARSTHPGVCHLVSMRAAAAAAASDAALDWSLPRAVTVDAACVAELPRR